MHHSPSGPSLVARLIAALTREPAAPRGPLSLRGRLVPVVVVTGIVAGLALGIPKLSPVVSSGIDQTAAVGLESSSAATDEDDSTADTEEPSGLVQWGVDGAGGAPSAAPAAPEVPAAPPVETAEVPAPEVETETPSSEAESDEPEATEETEDAEPAPPVAATSEPAPEPRVAPAPADPSAEGQVIALVNQERAAAGCGAVSGDEGLAALARAHSADMRDRDFFEHENPSGLDPFERGDAAGVTVMAENIAYGQPDPASVMTDWMNSPGHKANILNCDYTKLGVGIADGSGGPWWTQDFA